MHLRTLQQARHTCLRVFGHYGRWRNGSILAVIILGACTFVAYGDDSTPSIVQPTVPRPLPSPATITAEPVGPVAVNSLSPCFSNPAGSIFSFDRWGTTQNYIRAPTDAQFIFKSLAVCQQRDVEVQTFVSEGYVYLRLDSSGNAIYFYHNVLSPTGILSVGIVTGLDETAYPGGTYYPLYTNNNLVATVPGYGPNDVTGAQFTFGTQGFDIYAKFNGKEFVRFKDYRQMSTGDVAAKSRGSGNTGITTTSIIPLKTQPLFSNYAFHQLDLRDFGLRSIQTTGTTTATTSATFTGSISGNTLTVRDVSGTIAVGQRVIDPNGQTWGSGGLAPDTIITGDNGDGTWTVSNLQTVSSRPMSSGSTTLTLTQAKDFRVNDFVVVEIGAEAGAGARGTTGVGGQWPALTYTDLAAMLADTSQPADTFAWTQSDGLVRQWMNGPAAGVGGYLTVSSVTYDSRSGVVTLTMSRDVSGRYAFPKVGDSIAVTGLNPSSLNCPTFNCTVLGISGSRIAYQGPTGQSAPTGTATLTVGWSSYPAGPSYYAAKAVPMSLVARITAISNNGKTLTLDTAAATPATNANVYLDNELIINDLTQTPRTAPGRLAPITPSDLTLIYPSGKFALAGFTSVLNHSGSWTIQGQGPSSTTLFSPKGTLGAGVRTGGTTGMTVQDLTMSGNVGLEGFGLSWGTTLVPIASASLPSGLTQYDPSGKILTERAPGAVTQTSIWNYYETTGINLTGDNSVARNLIINDTFAGALVCQAATNCWGYDITVNVHDPRQVYTQWQINWVKTNGGGCQDCTINSTYLIQALECFGSGSTGPQFINPVLINAALSLNACWNWLVSGANITIDTSGTSPPHTVPPAWTAGQGIVQITNNTGASGSGTITNMTITENGYLNSNNDVEAGINVREVPSITIDGGSYSAPDWAPPSRLAGPMAIVSAAITASVNNFTACGAIKLQFGSVTNSRAKRIVAPTRSGNTGPPIPCPRPPRNDIGKSRH